MSEERIFSNYVLTECERQWKDNQEEIYGTWESQSDDIKAEYYNDIYENFYREGV